MVLKQWYYQSKQKKISENKWEAYIETGREKTNLDVIDWVKKATDLGAGEVLLTSVDQEGTRKGFDNELIRSVSHSVNIPVIASGGVGELEHFLQGVEYGKADALLAASVFHYKLLTIKEVKEYLSKNNIPVRLWTKNLSIQLNGMKKGYFPV